MADSGSGSGSDYDYTEDAMYPGGLPVLDQNTREDQIEKLRTATEARLAQHERDALISRFERKRQTTGWQYDLRTARLHHEVLDYFEWRHRFRYLKTMRGVRPNRDGGGASLFAEIEGNPDRDGVERRRVVVKYGILTQRLYGEMYWLQRFGKLEHVVNVVHLGDEEDRRYLDMVEQERLRAEREEETEEIEEEEEEEENYVIHDAEPAEDVDGPGQGAVDPVIQTADESASAFWESTLNNYYMGELGREYTVDWEEPENIAHGSLNLSHLLIGSLTPNDINHGLTPVLKMCAFGKTRNLPDNSRGLRQNQLAIGRIIQTLAIPASQTADQEEKGLLPLDFGRTEFAPGQFLDSCVHDEFIAAPHVSFELKDFVTFLMAANVEDMWPLDRLLDRTIQLSGRTAEKDFEGQEVPPDETDEAIAQFVQDHMFNASANLPPLGTTSGADGTSEQGPLTGILERTFGGFFGTGRNRGTEDFDPASFDIPDLPIEPLPPGFIPPYPDRAVEAEMANNHKKKYQLAWSES